MITTQRKMRSDQHQQKISMFSATDLGDGSAFRRLSWIVTKSRCIKGGFPNPGNMDLTRVGGRNKLKPKREICPIYSLAGPRMNELAGFAANALVF